MLILSSCEDNTLKRPESSENEKESSSMSAADREYVRELAREFAREFKKEVGSASLVVGNATDYPRSGLLDERGEPHPLLAHCSQPVLE